MGNTTKEFLVPKLKAKVLPCFISNLKVMDKSLDRKAAIRRYIRNANPSKSSFSIKPTKSFTCVDTTKIISTSKVMGIQLNFLIHASLRSVKAIS